MILISSHDLYHKLLCFQIYLSFFNFFFFLQIKALSFLVSCRDCGEDVTLSMRPTTKGMISEFVVSCTVCQAKKVTITPNLVRERKRKREVKGLVLQKTENINYAHVAAFLDNGLGYSGLRHYCKYFNARCLNEATFIVYARQVIQDVVNDTEDNLQSNARMVRRVYDADLDDILDITVSYATTYHQWGSDFCLVAGAVIELQTGLVLDYDVANMYCHVCKINAKRIISMTPTEMTEWFNKHQSSCEIREWCDELDHDAEEGVKDIEPKYLECFVAKKLWARSVEKFGFRYSTLIHESDEVIHTELLRAAPYGDTLVVIDHLTNCFSRRKSEHARTAFQNKLKSKCPRERVQTKDRIMYVYAMSIPEYNRFAVGSNIKLRELVRKMEVEEAETEGFTLQVLDPMPTIQAHEVIPADDEQSEVVYQMAGEEGQEASMYSIDGSQVDQDEEEEAVGEEEEEEEEQQQTEEQQQEEVEEEEEEEEEQEEAEEESREEEAVEKRPVQAAIALKTVKKERVEIPISSSEVTKIITTSNSTAVVTKGSAPTITSAEAGPSKEKTFVLSKGSIVSAASLSSMTAGAASPIVKTLPSTSGARTVVIPNSPGGRSTAPTQIIVVPASSSPGPVKIVTATTTTKAASSAASVGNGQATKVQISAKEDKLTAANGASSSGKSAADKQTSS